MAKGLRWGGREHLGGADVLEVRGAGSDGTADLLVGGAAR